MKKYTIKEFAEGKKAVKIENEEQWNKLNKVHELCDISSRNFGEYFNNVREWCNGEWYKDHDYKLLEFSQLDFEDGFVEGKWYKRVEEEGYLYQPEYVYYVKCNSTNKKEKGILNYSERINFGGTHIYYNNYCETSDFIQVDLSEIQQYLPENHPDLIKKDTFVLPEKWCVFSDQNKIITDWFNENQTGSYNMKQLVKDNLLFCYPAVEKWIYLANPHSCARPVKPQDYTEITFDQFKTYVLKEKTMEKEIIGYKLVKPKYEMASIKLLGWNLTTKLLINISEKGDIHRLKEAGVLDLWFEAVYAPKYSLPTINSYQGSYENGIIKYGCAEFSKMFFEHLNSTNSHLGNRTIKSIKLSSDVEITIEEIKQIVEYINKK